MPNPLTRLFASTARVGWANTVLYEVGRMLALVSFGRIQLRKYYFVAQPVPDAPLLPTRGRNIRFRWLAPDDATHVGPRPPAVIAERHRAGARCLVAELHGAFCAYLWLQLDAYHDDEVACRYAPQPQSESAWDFDVYVEPEQRLGFTFVKLWDEANAWLRSRGVRHSFSRISAFNGESLAAHGRMGSTRVGAAVFVTAGPAQLMISDLAPKLHVAWRGRSAPTLTLGVRRPAPSTDRPVATPLPGA